MALANCAKTISFLSQNSGVIAARAQQEIMTGNPEYALSRISETAFETGKGENPRYLRVRTTRPRQTAYQPMLPTGNQSYTATNPQTGVPTTVTGDVTGRGCSLAAETLSYGYDVHTSCLMGKAIEAGPWCILDLIRKEGVNDLLQQVWRDMPRYLKEDFGRQLLRDVITFSKYKFSLAPGMPKSTYQAYFPTVPTGGPQIGFLRQIERILVGAGWGKGSGIPMLNGRPVVEFAMGREAIDWMVAQHKIQEGYEVRTEPLKDDGVFGQTVAYNGLRMIEMQFPTRGYLRMNSSSTYEFVEIDPTITTVAAGEGFWTEENPDYYSSVVHDNGADYRVLEVGYAIHPTAMERQALGSIPSVPGKSFTRAANWDVQPIEPWDLAARGCNKDQFFFGYRALHMYAPLPKNPELMTAFLFLAPTNRYTITDPWQDQGTSTILPVGLAPLTAPQTSDCNPCSAVLADGPREPILPTCDTLFPANGVGAIRQRQTAYAVQETAGSVLIVVDRVGGNTGAASVAYTTTAGTATAGTNYTTTTGTLNWADGVSGSKTFSVPILNHTGDDDGKQFTVTISSATGATLGTPTVATVTILDADENV